MIRWLPFFLLACVDFCESRAQSTQKTVLLQGRIFRPDGKPLAGAEIRSGSSEPTKSIAGGHYYLMLRSGRRHIVTVSFRDFKTIEMPVVLQRDTMMDIHMEMVDGSILMEEVTIVRQGIRPLESMRAGVTTLRIQTVEKLPTLLGEKDVIKVLQLLPGVAAQAEGSTEMHVRGGNSDQNLVLLDGIPLYGSSHLFGMFSPFNPLMVKEASFYTGFFPAKYGGRISSVTDVSTRLPTSKFTTGEVELGVTSAKGFLEIPMLNGKSALLLGGRRSFLDLWNRLAGRDRTELFNFYDLNGIWTYRPNGKHLVKLSTYAEGDGFSYAVDDGSEYRYSALHKNQQTASLQWRYYPSSTMTHGATVKFGRYANVTHEKLVDTVKSDTEYDHRLKSTAKDLSVNYQMDYQPLRALSVQAGGNYAIQGIRPTDFYGTDNGVDFSFEPVPYRRATAFSLYGGLGYRIGQTTLQSELRNSYFRNGSYGYRSWEPRIAVEQGIGEHWKLTAAYSRMTQPLQRLVNPGLGMPLDIQFPSDDRIPSQRSDIYSLGVAKTFGGEARITVSAEAYMKRMANVIEFRDGYDTRSVLHQTFNAIYRAPTVYDMLSVGRGRAKGIDLMVELQTNRLQAWLSYSLMKAEAQHDQLNGSRWFPALQDRRHQLNLVVNWKLSDRWDLSATWTYLSGQPLTLPVAIYPTVFPTQDERLYTTDRLFQGVYGSRNAVQMEPFHKLDVNFTVKTEWLGREGLLSFGAYNVYNRANPSFYYLGKHQQPDGTGSRPAIKRVSVFPVMPSVSYKWVF
ncbi:MAG: hypothetical protein EAS52_14680 [Parapedobacter sp.]|nr:MAG: hypothetical protein EAS52_14680 [Parapedobacter sp.]